MVLADDIDLPKRSPLAWLTASLVVIGMLVCGAVVVVLWTRSHASAAVVANPSRVAPSTATTTTAASTPTPTSTPTSTSTTAATTAVTPPSTPTAASNAVPSPAATTGQITVPPSRAGHRVWIDGHIVGEAPGSFTVSCGSHKVRVGSQGAERSVNAPCGGDVEAR